MSDAPTSRKNPTVTQPTTPARESKEPPTDEELAAQARAAAEREAKAERDEVEKTFQSTFREYVYSGPFTTATLRSPDHPEVKADVVLHTGEKVKLPAEDTYTRGLIDQGYLKTAEEVAKANARKAARKGQN